MAHKGNHTTETFFYRYPRISFKKGTMLIGADENPTGIFFIEKGFVKQYVVSPKGEVLMLTIFRPGAFVPLTWGLNKTIKQKKVPLLPMFNQKCKSKRRSLHGCLM